MFHWQGHLKSFVHFERTSVGQIIGIQRANALKNHKAGLFLPYFLNFNLTSNLSFYIKCPSHQAVANRS